MDDQRGSDPHQNGAVSRSLAYGGPPPVAHSRQSAPETDSTDLGQFRLTRIIGEASYHYGKMKEAEQEKRLADGEYHKQSQYFDNNSKLREAVESRRSRSERTLSATRSDYAKAAREAEPLLRRLSHESPSATVDEETIRKIIQVELKEFVMFRDLDKEVDKLYDRLERKFHKTPAEVRSMVHQELKNYTHKSEFERLADQIRGMNVRTRQMSVSSDTSRDVDQRIVAQARDMESIRTELTTKTAQQGKELILLKERINNLQKDAALQQPQRIQMASGTKSEDIAKVESALEKAQEVINDQYVTIHDLQLQVNTALEGIRILNEHIQEYDKRVDGLQTSTQTFFAEVQAENRKQHDVICRALDELHDKLAADIAAKTAIPKSPVPVNFPSQNLDSPQMGGFSPTIPNLPSIAANPMAPIVQRIEGHSKSIQELNAHIATLHQRGVDQQRQIQTVLQIPSSVQRFCDDVSARLHASQNEHTSLTERVNAIDLAMNSIKVTLTTHITNVNNNFGETATHMDSVKKRFGEHRNQLENLITGWRETLSAMDQLEGKYDALKKFLQNKIIPTIVKVQMSSPDLLKAGNSANDSPNQGNNGTSDDATQNRLLTTMAAATGTGSGERRLPPAEGGGGAFNPIEL